MTNESVRQRKLSPDMKRALDKLAHAGYMRACENGAAMFLNDYEYIPKQTVKALERRGLIKYKARLSENTQASGYVLAHEDTGETPIDINIEDMCAQAEKISQVHPVNLGGYLHVMKQNGLVVVKRSALEALVQTLSNAFSTLSTQTIKARELEIMNEQLLARLDERTSNEQSEQA